MESNPDPLSPVIAILGAGAASRMRGRDKLLEPIGGAPLLSVVAQRALGLGLPVIVTVPTDSQRIDALAVLPVRCLPVADANSGMAASFRAIGRAVPDRPVLVVLGDMPEITEEDMARLVACWRENPDAPLRATAGDGTPGQPVLFPARLTARFPELTGDTGARGLLANEVVRHCALPGRRALVDLDTPEAWAAWRKRRGIPG